MNNYLTDKSRCLGLATTYQKALLDDVIPFWLRHGVDQEHGGVLTALDRDGAVVDSDKSIWFQGRAAWMFAALFNTVEKQSSWLEAARSCVEFLRRHGSDSSGKMYFTVTRDGFPLRMRRYVFSESFAAIGFAAYARAAGDGAAAEEAVGYFERFLRYSFEPGLVAPKADIQTRPKKSIAPLMITINTAQELRDNIGDVVVQGQNCTQWIDRAIGEIERDFFKPDHEVLMETVGPRGEILDHFDSRMLNPGHALEAAWFIMHEGKFRGDRRLMQVGMTILDWMWKRGWDGEFGGLFYFRDLRGLPVQEYWHDMKFWWPHCEAIIATALAWNLSGEPRYAEWHAQVHDWSFKHFADRQFGEWYGYLHRDGTVSTPLKGTMWKGPFHLPRMLWYCARLLADDNR